MANDTGSKRRSHYQERRAHADGWEVEVYVSREKVGLPSSNPRWLGDLKYRIVPDADGWLPWYGTTNGIGPFDDNPVVQVQFSDGEVLIGAQSCWFWDDHIIRYRPHKPAPTKTYQATLDQLKVLSWIVCDLDAVKGVFRLADGIPARVEEGHRILEEILGDDCPLIYGEPE